MNDRKLTAKAGPMGPQTPLKWGFLLIMALGLAACSQTTTSEKKEGAALKIDRSADVRVATVNGTPIYDVDVRRAAQAQGLIGAEEPLPVNGPIFKTTLDDLIDQRLLWLDAKEAGLDKAREARLRLSAAQERILGNYRVETHLATVVNDQSIRELYEAQRALAGGGQERLIRRIVVEEEALALEIAQRLNEEEDFETLAQTYSVDPSAAETGGTMGWVSRSMLSGAVANAAFSTPVGTRSAPFQADGTWQILDIQDVRSPASRSFEDVREDITRFMTFEAVNDLMTELREQADITRFEMPPDVEGDRDGEPGDGAQRTDEPGAEDGVAGQDED